MQEEKVYKQVPKFLSPRITFLSSNKVEGIITQLFEGCLSTQFFTDCFLHEMRKNCYHKGLRINIEWVWCALQKHLDHLLHGYAKCFAKFFQIHLFFWSITVSNSDGGGIVANFSKKKFNPAVYSLCFSSAYQLLTSIKSLPVGFFFV